MSILVVGGAGHIGSEPAKRVAQAGPDPVVFDSHVRWKARIGKVEIIVERAWRWRWKS